MWYYSKDGMQMGPVSQEELSSLLAQGDLAGASAASNSAKNWALAGAISWLVLVVLPFLVFFIIGAVTAISAP